MKKEIFSDWLENPVTLYFLKYLVDSANEAAKLTADDIINGVIVSEPDQIKTATMCLTLKNIAVIDLDEIKSFYEENHDQQRKESRIQ